MISASELSPPHALSTPSAIACVTCRNVCDYRNLLVPPSSSGRSAARVAGHRPGGEGESFMQGTYGFAHRAIMPEASGLRS